MEPSNSSGMLSQVLGGNEERSIRSPSKFSFEASLRRGGRSLEAAETSRGSNAEGDPAKKDGVDGALTISDLGPSLGDQLVA